MARRNRVSVPDAVYHITTRIAHRALLLVGDGVKDAVFRMIYDVALFSGVEVFACCVMENHLHLLVHVPRVPAEYWTDEAAEPDAYAFGMRPPERRRPMWPGSGDGRQCRVNVVAVPPHSAQPLVPSRGLSPWNCRRSRQRGLSRRKGGQSPRITGDSPQ